MDHRPVVNFSWAYDLRSIAQHGCRWLEFSRSTTDLLAMSFFYIQARALSTLADVALVQVTIPGLFQSQPLTSSSLVSEKQMERFIFLLFADMREHFDRQKRKGIQDGVEKRIKKAMEVVSVNRVKAMKRRIGERIGAGIRARIGGMRTRLGRWLPTVRMATEVRSPGRN